MTKKYFLLLLVVVVLVGIVYFLLRNDGPEETQPRIYPPVSESQSGELTNPGIANSGETSTAAVQDLDKKKVTEAPVTQPAASAAVPAWQSNNTEPSPIPIPDGVVIYESISVDMDSPAFPEPGQQVALGLPGGEIVNATVRSSNENPNGDYSWRGYLEGYGTDYPVIMTYGANSVFATITTPQGSYTMESVNGRGLVYKNPAEFELSEPGKGDSMEIPHHHDHDH